MIKKIFIALLVAKGFLFAADIQIAAAADLKFALEEIAKAYEAKYKNDQVKVSFGASGKLTTQIMNGAPFELFFAANIEYPEKLKAAGQTVGEIKPYAIGRLAILTKKGSGVDVKKGISILTSEQVKKISIANPDVAPYGKAAVEVLKHYGIYEKVQSKLIKGENVQQAANFGITGATDVAVVAHSLALSPTISKEIEYYLIDGSAHPKMIQAYTMTKKGAANPSAKNFLAFFESKESDIILKKYGFTLE